MHDGEVTLHGSSIAPGIGIGLACLEELPGTIPRYRISKSSAITEQDRFHHALNIARRNLKRHIKSAHGLLDDELNQVLKAHEMMLHDQEIFERMENNIFRCAF